MVVFVFWEPGFGAYRGRFILTVFLALLGGSRAAFVIIPTFELDMLDGFCVFVFEMVMLGYEGTLWKVVKVDTLVSR